MTTRPFWTRDDLAASAFGMDQLPPLVQIAVRPISPSRYLNARLANFGNWYRDNEPALTERFNQLPGDGDFFDFAASQYDIERMRNPTPPRYIERLSEREAYGSDRR